MADICPVCKYTLPVDRYERPGKGILNPGTYHYNDCPTIPHLSAEAEARLQENLDEIACCRRRAWASAHNYVIG